MILLLSHFLRTLIIVLYALIALALVIPLQLSVPIFLPLPPSCGHFILGLKAKSSFYFLWKVFIFPFWDEYILLWKRVFLLGP